MKSVVALSAAAAILPGAVDAFWRMDCHSRSGLARIDPIVTPGKVSSHVHAVHGGSSKYIHSLYSLFIPIVENILGKKVGHCDELTQELALRDWGTRKGCYAMRRMGFHNGEPQY